MKAPILTATTARIWVHFLALFGALEKREHIVSKYSMYSKQNIWFFCHNHTVPDLQAFNSWSPVIGPHFLCGISGVVPLNTWLISSWEDDNCYYKLSNWQKNNYLHSEWQLCQFVSCSACNKIYFLLSLR